MPISSKPTHTSNIAYPLIVVGASLFVAMLIYLGDDHARVLGPTAQSLINTLIAKSFGLSAYFFPFACLFTGFTLLRHDKVEAANRLPSRLFFSFLSLLLVNSLLLNTSLSQGPYAGVFPLFVHALFLHYLGSENHITLTSFLAELFFATSSVVFWAALLFHKKPNEIISIVLTWLTRIYLAVSGLIKTSFHTFLAWLETKKILYPVADSVSPDTNAWWIAWPPKEKSNLQFTPPDLAKAETIVEEADLKINHPDQPTETSSERPVEVFTQAGEVPSTEETNLNPIGSMPTPPSGLKINRLDETLPGSSEALSPGDLISPDESLAILGHLENEETNSPTHEPSEWIAPEPVDLDLSSFSLISGAKKPLSEAEEMASVDQTLTPKVAADIPPAAKNKLRTPLVLNRNTTEPSNASCRADINVLEFSPPVRTSRNDDFIRQTARKLEETIRDFGVETKVVEVSTGPVITRYELSIESGVKISKIVNLSDNIALSLAAQAVRIVAPIPGKSVIGIEIPNESRQMVRVRDVVDTPVFNESRYDLPIALGKSILGESVIADLAATPHLLIAGATGSGKSVCVNAVICSLLFKRSPSEIRFLMIDPKMVELNVYNGIPHLLTPVITDAKKAASSLRWVISEMEARYCLLEKYAVRSIKGYNELIRSKLAKREKLEDDVGTLPYIVVIIDEFADLMMIARKEVEDSVTRLAAMSRAVGIHLILATQRPSVDVITGIIKANFPSRIAFQVSSKIDSRTILDASGADKLLGKGDMLFQVPASAMPERIQGAFLSDDEVHRVVENLASKGSANYIEDFFSFSSDRAETDENGDEMPAGQKDPLWNDALDIVINEKKASASYLQRRLKIGYNRAARLIEEMEALNLVGAADGSRPREVLVSNRP